MANCGVTNQPAAKRQWPDQLQPPEPARVAWLLAEFWRQLARLPDLLNRQEFLLADQLTQRLREIIIEMMLALNGIQWPPETSHLNAYLGASQRSALQKTLTLAAANAESWIGQAVALVVIYQWYAPQLVDRFAVARPQAVEAETLALLGAGLADWPLSITTD